jgi:hypothetical protein
VEYYRANNLVQGLNNALQNPEALNQDGEKISNKVFSDLAFVRLTSDQGAILADQLEAKYLLNSPFSDKIFDEQKLRADYEDRLIIDPATDLVLTIDQGARLLEGRALLLPTPNQHLAGDGPAETWYQRRDDGKMLEFPNDGGYNMEKEISGLPIKEVLGNMPLNDIVSSLRNGESYTTTYVENGQEEPVEIVANPFDRTIDMHFPGAAQNKSIGNSARDSGDDDDNRKSRSR